MNRQTPYFDANVDPYSTPQMLIQKLSLQENAAIEQAKNSVLDSRMEYEKQGETEQQSHEQDMEIGYEDKLQSLAFEALEKTFQDEILKLMEDQIHAENAENSRHRQKLMEINNKYQEKLSGVRAKQASRREEFLRKESGQRLGKYEQSSTIRTSSTNLYGYTLPTSTEDSTVKDPSAAFSSSTSSDAATSSNAFSFNWQSPKSPIFGSPSTGFSFGASSTASAATNASLSTGFSFGASSTASAATNASPSTGFSFGASSTASATKNASPFSFGASSASSATTDASPFSFGASFTSSAPTNAPQSTGFSFGASSAPTNASPSTGFSFGASANASQSARFSFGASGSLGGSFALGSGGGDNPGRKIDKRNRSKNRKELYKSYRSMNRKRLIKINRNKNRKCEGIASY